MAERIDSNAPDRDLGYGVDMRTPHRLLLPCSLLWLVAACGVSSETPPGSTETHGSGGKSGSGASSGTGGSGASSGTGGTGASSGTGGSGASSGTGGTGAVGGTGGSAPCEATGFATSPLSFTLPSLPKPIPQTGGSASCPNAIQGWHTLDVTGDGAVDLVLTQSCTDNLVGSGRWEVYPGTGSGFATSPLSFTTPMMPVPILDISQSVDCAGSKQTWSTFDVTGDGRVDLVITRSCTDTSVGTTHWEVYPGSGSGFATSPMSFTLPSLPKPLLQTGGSTSCSLAPQAWSTFDVTGDGKVDLVLTGSCTDNLVGVDHWEVYPGTGSGFATSPLSFATPNTPVRILDTSQSIDCAASKQTWSTFDATGDRKVDLVLTQSCTDTSVGTTHWEVYPSSGSGFAASPLSFALPSLPKPILKTGGAASCPNAIQGWHTLDVTGDGTVDLVLTQSCTDNLVGVDHWEVYPGTGSGFATSPVSFTTPTTPVPLVDITQSVDCAGSKQAWGTFDVTGDGKVDLVFTQSCTDTAAGKTHWEVYPGMCAP